MKKRLFAISTMALALVGVAWPNVGAAQSFYDQVQANERYAMKRSEVELRQMGLDARLAHNAVWAMNNWPASACATSASLLLGDYESRSTISRSINFDNDRVADIESSGVCEMKAIKRPPPKEEPYDPKTDSQYQGKLFFQNHPEEAYEILLKEGVSLIELNNIATIFTRSTYRSSGCTTLAGLIIYLARKGKGDTPREEDMALYRDSLDDLKGAPENRGCNPNHYP
ncbi:hypothetical protein GS501_04930 [Saccharibacter sp. 17.LH.SD]|uniref:hypothetical protein n=1 Tax=Saccharibacter sp. 17.LH.SD TaxID=2689393 RepID=UPI00136AA81B|nr:hypothetical protein [Saccharibacter sp. 17.LH.SD]MXV44391.1 hypothetical protein [Saccharibacter sp. 17.LH.SD]